MKRVVDTSAGRVVLSFGAGDSVDAYLIGDDGWETRESSGDWDNDAWSPRDVAWALIDVAGIEREEADAIAAQVQREYEARGKWRPPDDDEYPSTWSRILGWSVITFLIGACLIGLGTIAVFIWDTFPVGAVILGLVLAYGTFLILRSAYD